MNNQDKEKQQERYVYWLLLITSTYVIIHMSIYIWRNYIDVVFKT